MPNVQHGGCFQFMHDYLTEIVGIWPYRKRLQKRRDTMRCCYWWLHTLTFNVCKYYFFKFLIMCSSTLKKLNSWWAMIYWSSQHILHKEGHLQQKIYTIIGNLCLQIKVRFLINWQCYWYISLSIWNSIKMFVKNLKILVFREIEIAKVF